MREQCVPGAPSDFSSVWERGYAQTHTVQDMFWPIPGLISCTGHTHAANEITWHLNNALNCKTINQ